MTNGSSFVQFGQHLIPTDGIRNIDLYCAREGGAPGTMVRVHLHTTPGAMYTGPNHIDFTGRDAQTIRTWATKAATTGVVIPILEAPETGAAAGKG